MTALKYTDRDVRENNSLVEFAMEYLLHYQGEFDFLVDCKMRISTGHDLTVGMVRGVLNCMRSDPRVTRMPDPMPPSEQMGEVIELIQPKAYNKKMKSKKLVPCPLYEAKLVHTHRRKNDAWYDTYENCHGYYRINRDPRGVDFDAVVKPPFIVARHGKAIHKATGVGRVRWYPKYHEYGWSQDPRISVQVACKYPRWIDGGLLLFTPEALDCEGNPFPLCVRCFVEGEPE